MTNGTVNGARLNQKLYIPFLVVGLKLGIVPQLAKFFDVGVAMSEEGP